MSTPPTDLGIPILTEIIGPQTTLPPEQPAPPPASLTPAHTPAPAPQAAARPSAAPAPAAPTAPAAMPPQAAAPAAPARSPLPELRFGAERAAPAAPVVPAVQDTPELPRFLAKSASWPATPPAAETPPPMRPAAAMPPSAAPSVPVPSAAEPAPVAPSVQADALDAPTASPWSEINLDELENELRQRITRQVLGRIDFVLDHRVRNTLTDVVDTAIDTLALEIKRGLHATLTDMVARAVAQEIARLQSGKN